tara:strand:- start:1023 stop:1670 length:648 start_codon:yes stop_codon:yes gene_type:complete
MNKLRIGILGGAFDPVHVDHIKLAEACLEHNLVDQVWFTPSPSIRWDKETLFNSAQRCEILKRSIQDNPKIKLCDLEIKAGPYRGAYVFLTELKRNYREYDFFLIMGADTYSGVLNWRDPRGLTLDNHLKFNGHLLLKEIPLILFSREGSQYPSKESHRKYSKLKLSCIDVDGLIGSASSTQVRDALNLGLSITDLVPKNSEALIQDTYEQKMKN